MTSNIGSQQIQELSAQGAEDWEIEAAVRTILKRGTAGLALEQVGKAAGVPAQLRSAIADAAGSFFRPELLNRIDEVVVFKTLKKEMLKSIVDIQLEGLCKRLAQRQITLTLTDAAKSQLATEGWDPAFGARPLKRTIQQRIENMLAMKILSGDVSAGDTVCVDYDGARFVAGG